MNRRINKLINCDHQIIDLRMQAEELINNMESIPDDQYKEQADFIESQIELRIAEIIRLNRE